MSLTGEPSLQNALEYAGRVLKPLPGHASRELLVLFASLTTCDPGDINTNIQVILALHKRAKVLEVNSCVVNMKLCLSGFKNRWDKV